MTWLVEHPVAVAPMAGGPTTAALVMAAGRAGGFGFLAAGSKSVDAVAAEVEEVAATGLAYGVNVFVPGAMPAPRVSAGTAASCRLGGSTPNRSYSACAR